MLKKSTILFILLICFFANAQQVTTITGFLGSGYEDGSLATAKLRGPHAVRFDTMGNIYVADTFNNRIRKIDIATGLVSTLAGGTEGSANGIGSDAQFFLPTDLCFDSNGFLFVVDGNNNRIRKIDVSTRMVTTFAGSIQGYANGNGTNAKFNDPFGICIDSNDNIYVSEYLGGRIRKITPNGRVSTFAGSGVAGFADGVGSAAMFYSPEGLCVDAQNNIYVADTVNFKVRKITPDGTVTTIAGGTYGYLDGPIADAMLKSVNGICMDNQNNLYVTENNKIIRKIDLNANVVSTFMSESSLPGDPFGICFNNGTIYFTEVSRGKIKKITNLLNPTTLEEIDFNIYPNPNNGIFNIESKTSISSIYIYDARGRTTYFNEKVYADKVVINLTAFAKGLYLVKIIGEEGKITTKKIVID
jgi:sugar lactone lactonase YvrE